MSIEEPAIIHPFDAASISCNLNLGAELEAGHLVELVVGSPILFGGTSFIRRRRSPLSFNWRSHVLSVGLEPVC